MPRQNRVDPFGKIIAVPDRGMFMGNRGCLHDAAGRIKRRWALKRWIICLTCFKGRQRRLMQPGRYTELFFLDEATGLAAGHRPCSECQRDRYKLFLEYFRLGGDVSPGKMSASQMDDCLHVHRVDSDGRKVTWQAALPDLPTGVMFVMPDKPSAPMMVWGNRSLTWTPAGYTAADDHGRDTKVNVLTPKQTAATVVAGYVPAIHPTAKRFALTGSS